MAVPSFRKDTLRYYKSLAISLLSNRGNLSYTIVHEDDPDTNLPYDKSREIEVLRQHRMEVVSDIYGNQKQELCGIISELTTAQGSEYIMVFGKYLQAVRKMPSTWKPNTDRLNKDYSELKKTFSDFLEAFSNIGFVYQHINQKPYCDSLFDQLLQMATILSDTDKELFVKLTKRLSVIDRDSLNIDPEELLLIKALRVIIMAMQLGHERSLTTRNKVVSIINPKLTDYTIFNEKYVDEILRLSDKTISGLLLTALIKEERPDVPSSVITSFINGVSNHRNLVKDLAH